MSLTNLSIFPRPPIGLFPLPAPLVRPPPPNCPLVHATKVGHEPVPSVAGCAESGHR